MITYFDFKKRNLDLSALGFSISDTPEVYYCTPKGAHILGSSGVDGIHYCTVPGFGDLIFAVSPMNSEDPVHPIAGSFEDLLRLLLACGDMAALDQCFAWNEEQFFSFLQDNPATPEQQEVLSALRREFDLSPIEDVYHYVKNLQAEVDCSKIPYTREYCELTGNPTPPEEDEKWQVFFDRGFTKDKRQRPGEEIVLGKSFTWGDELWHVPSVYSCGKGLVIDCCVEIDPSRFQNFLDKWLSLTGSGKPLSEEMEENLSRENPLTMEFEASLFMNGKKARRSTGAGSSWIPERLLPDNTINDSHILPLMKHYGLDPERIWSFQRISFPWPGSRSPKIRQLILNLKRSPENLEVCRFKDPNAGDVISFVHPLTGTEHRLTVLEYEPQEVVPEIRSGYDFPNCFKTMTYSLDPDLSEEKFQVRDCRNNDAPRRVRTGSDWDTDDGPAAVAIAILRPAGTKEGKHVTFSAMHFVQAQSVEWKIVLREKLMDDMAIELIN